MAAHRQLPERLLTVPFLILSVLAIIGFYFIGERFIYGLGAVTNINPGYPWGIWVVVDIVVGTAFGCGGFAIALLVYIFNRGAYHPLMRPALLGGLFGYTLAGVAVMIDLGRYWNFYNLMLPWYAQPNSVMFEVAMCVMAYVTVLWIEFSPAFLERLGLTNIKKHLQRVLFVFIALGVLLPTMHQSSLGSVLLVMGSQLSPLWYTLFLPLLFLLTALMMGYGIVMLEATLVTNAFNLPSEAPILAKLSKIVMWIVAAFLTIRIVDIVARGHAGLIFAGDVDSLLFIIEMLLFAGALAILATQGGRASDRMTFLAACLLLAGGTMHRIDAYLIAYNPVGSWTYFPSAPELMVTIGVISIEILLYLVFIKKLPVLHSAHA